MRTLPSAAASMTCSLVSTQPASTIMPVPEEKAPLASGGVVMCTSERSTSAVGLATGAQVSVWLRTVLLFSEEFAAVAFSALLPLHPAPARRRAEHATAAAPPTKQR